MIDDRMKINCPNSACMRFLGTTPVTKKECPDNCGEPIALVSFDLLCPKCGTWTVVNRILHTHRPQMVAEFLADLR